MNELHELAQDAVVFTRSEAEPNSPYAKAANAVARAIPMDDEERLRLELRRLAYTLEGDLRPEWDNDPDGTQRAVVERIFAEVGREND